MDDESGHNAANPSSNSSNNNNIQRPPGQVVVVVQQGSSSGSAGGNNGNSSQQLPSGSGGGGGGSNSPFNRRIRRSSSSIISSTTSPIFQAPLNPNVIIQPSQANSSLLHHQISRQRHSQNNIVLNNVSNPNSNNNYVPGDIDEDAQPASSSSSNNNNSRLSRAIAGSSNNSNVGGSSSASVGGGNNNNGRSQSPLGSPDSSTYWGPSPSPISQNGHHHTGSGGGGYRAPLTPGGMCVVSSSTSDDIPPSPFSPEDIGGNSNPHNSIGINGNSSSSVSIPAPPPSDLSDNNNGEREELQPPPSIPRSRLGAAISGLSSSRRQNSSQNNQQNLNQDLSHHHNMPSSNPSPSTSSSSPSSLSFNISPLRNKIKKASSFERFSAQAATNSLNSASNSNAIANNSGNDSQISSAQIPPPASASASQQNPGSSGSMSTNASSSISIVNVGGSGSGSSRLMWDASLQSALASSGAVTNNVSALSSSPVASASSESSQSTSSALLRSLTGISSDKFHIKIPSKKLAAKLASAYEQQQEQHQHQELAAAASSSSLTGGSVSGSSSGSIISGTPLISSLMNSTSSVPVSSSSLVQILNQSPSNINVNVSNLISDDSILSNSVSSESLMRELSDVPLNLTDSNSNSNNNNSNSQQSSSSQSSSLMPPRNPVISSRSLTATTLTHSKKIHLTPKQKLLHRIQSAELIGSLSPPPLTQSLTQSLLNQQNQIQTSSSQQLLQPQQQQQQQLQQSVTPTSNPVVSLHQNISLVQDSQVQQSLGSNGGHVIGGGNSIGVSGGPHSPPQLESYSYESLLRSRDDFNAVQDSLGKVVGDDPSGSAMLYDPDYASYCYQGIFTDEIFSSNNGGTNGSSRPLLMMPAGSLQDAVDHPHGQFGEFVLGLGVGGPEDDHDRRDAELQLNSDGGPVGNQQGQCLDPNETLNTIKSQSQADSALRNLLMMDNIRNSHVDDTWLLSTTDYQTRSNNDMISSRSLGLSGLRLNNSSSLTMSSVGSGGSSSAAAPSFLQMANSLSSNSNSAWMNEWPRTSSWQAHPSVIGGGVVQDQDEGMDMSMLDHDKTSSVGSKRIQIQLQQQGGSSNGGNGQNGIEDDMDLTNGLPMLSSMQMPMPMDLHQPLGILQHGSSSSMKDTLPMDLQQHNRMEIDDEPVNLMAVNIEQELAHHHNSHHSLAHQIHLQHGEGSKLHNLLQQSQSHHHGQGNNNNSYTLQIQSHHGSPDMQQQQQQQQQSLGDYENSNGHNNNVSNGCSGSNSSPGPDIIDERRIIRAKRNRDSLFLMSSLDDGCLSGNEEHEQQQQMQSQKTQAHNVIMDKPIQPKSFASLPSPLNILRVHGTTLGVFTGGNKTILANTQLGPVEGPVMAVHASDIHNPSASYPCLIYPDSSRNQIVQLDRSDDDLCNWMKFVRLAHSYEEQNAVVVENDDYLYFITCKEIPPKTELLVGYGHDYAHKYGLLLLTPPSEQQSANSGGGDQKKGDKDSLDAMSLIQSDRNPSPLMIEQNMTSSNSQQQMNNAGHSREAKSVIVGGTMYECFMCDHSFTSLDDLQNHLKSDHEDEDEKIQKPKKKAIKKFQNPDNIPESMPSLETISASAFAETVSKAAAHGSIQNQFMSADSSVGRVESSSIPSSQDVTISQKRASNNENNVAEVASSGTSSGSGRPQDNSVSTGGGGQTSVPPKVKCTMCYKSFATKERLDRHMIVHSADETKPLQCQFCTKRFLTNSALAGHIKTHAEEGKFFECPMCNFHTQQLLQLKEHVQSHKNRETGSFSCPQCTKSFSMYHMIRKHIRAFHGPRQFSCDQCSMSFPTSDKLKLHKLKHSDHREFLCAECGRQFKRKDKLREHTKRIHETKKKIIELNIGKDNKNSKKFTPKFPPEEYQRFAFKCQDCMVGFKRRGMLVNHMAKRHPEKKLKTIPELNQPIVRPTRNYFCLYCERVYKSSSKRKAHIIKTHPGKPIPPQLRGIPSVNSEPVVVSQEIIVPSALPQPPIGTIVQTVTDDGDARHGIMNVSTSNLPSTNSSSGASNLVSTTSNIMRKEIVVGKVQATAHGCPWCHREYATRAKLLQHQRKSHIHLMPLEMQTPRTQKNNVAKVMRMGKQNAEATALRSNVSSTRLIAPAINTGGTSSSDSQSLQILSDPLYIPDSSSGTPSTANTIQTMASSGDALMNEANVIGYILTTANGDISNLVSSEIVVLPVQNLGDGNGGAGGSIMNVLQAPHHHQSLTINGVNVLNPNQNIAIITSNSSALSSTSTHVSSNSNNTPSSSNGNNSESNSGSNVISNIINVNSNSSISVTHPILTQME